MLKSSIQPSYPKRSISPNQICSVNCNILRPVRNRQSVFIHAKAVLLDEVASFHTGSSNEGIMKLIAASDLIVLSLHVSSDLLDLVVFMQILHAPGPPMHLQIQAKEQTDGNNNNSETKELPLQTPENKILRYQQYFSRTCLTHPHPDSIFFDPGLIEPLAKAKLKQARRNLLLKDSFGSPPTLPRGTSLRTRPSSKGNASGPLTCLCSLAWHLGILTSRTRFRRFSRLTRPTSRRFRLSGRLRQILPMKTNENPVGNPLYLNCNFLETLKGQYTENKINCICTCPYIQRLPIKC